MANITSQIKRNRQNLVRRERNKKVRSALKTQLKHFASAAKAGDAETAATAYRSAARELDKAAQKGLVHRNYVANQKSKMSKTLQSL